MVEGMEIDEQSGPSAAEKGKAVMTNGSQAPPASNSKGYELPWVSYCVHRTDSMSAAWVYWLYACVPA